MQEQSYIYRGEPTQEFDCTREEEMIRVHESLDRMETMIEDLHTQMHYSMSAQNARRV